MVELMGAAPSKIGCGHKDWSSTNTIKYFSRIFNGSVGTVVGGVKVLIIFS